MSVGGGIPVQDNPPQSFHGCGGGGGGRPMARVEVGVGVWSIRWHPEDEGRMLVGVIHGGCWVVEVPGLGGRGNEASAVK